MRLRKSFAVASIAMFAFVSTAESVVADYDSLYTAETGFVTMTGNDNKDSSGFAGKGKWSDGLPPHSGTNYYVGAGRTFCTPNTSELNGHVFEGNRLVVAGSITHTAGSGVTISWSDTEFLPGSEYYFNSVGEIAAGVFTVKGREDKPFRFRIERNSGGSREIIQKMNMASDELGYTVINQNGTVRQSFTYMGDWSGYYGTFKCPTNLYIQLGKGFESPGRFVVPDGGVLSCLSNDSVVVLGNLDVASGGKVCFKGSAEGTLLHITNRLSLAAGAIIDTSNIFNRAESPIHTSMVFRLSPKAVAAGIPDWNSVVYPFRKKGALGDLPHIVPFVMDDPEVEGGKFMGLRMKEVVYMTNSCSHYESALDLVYGKPEEFWSDGRWPEAGKDYVLNQNFIVDRNNNPYVFTGDSLTARACQFGMYKNMNDLTFDDMAFLGKTVFRPMEGSSTYTVRGGLKLISVEDYPDPAQIAIFNDIDFNIASDISGENDFCAYIMRLGGSISVPSGTIRLSGDNSNWMGKLLVAATNDVYNTSKGLVEINALTNLTLRVSDARNLGGGMPEFVYDALTVSNQCRLAVDGTTTFSEATRGWYFPRTAYLYVTNDATATCLNTLTIGGELVKEGAGTLCIGARPSVEGAFASVSVREGMLAASVSDAFSGLSVSLNEGSSLGIVVNSSDAGFKLRGIDLRDVVISALQGTSVPVSLIGVSGELSEGCGPYALFTCASGQMADNKMRFRILNPWPGESVSVRLTENDNGDGTVTLSASFCHCGLRVIVR